MSAYLFTHPLRDKVFSYAMADNSAGQHGSAEDGVQSFGYQPRAYRKETEELYKADIVLNRRRDHEIQNGT